MGKIIQNDMKSKLDDIATSIVELKAPKVVIAFRAYCAKNFPNNDHTYKSENPGLLVYKNFFLLGFYIFYF